MSSTTKPIQVEAFEQIKASSRMALLRLIFRAGSNRSGQTRISKLVVNNHNSVHRVAPLPALPAPGGAERVAFAVPYELLGGERSFSVELENGALVDLPYPLASTSTPVVPPARPVTAPAQIVEAVPAGTDDEQVRAATATKTLEPGAVALQELRQAYELAEDRLLTETELRAAAESDAEALRARVEQVTAEAEEHNRELLARCADLDRRLADALAEVEAVTKAERRAVRETRQLKDKLARQAAQLDELQAPQS